jgi:hypothetical protein
MQFDADKDGKLDREELMKFAESMPMMRRGEGQGPGGPGFGGPRPEGARGFRPGGPDGDRPRPERPEGERPSRPERPESE